ncbi:hypothetical protein [Streptomyces sp. JHA26]|uniref:hypothetical protein n=1 Tax=Streptomyces sp. JHA26 TaxID=1917143 RepID=UPI00209B1558|nr:hypothetical protein [Streptomyces sp. JHA26]
MAWNEWEHLKVANGGLTKIGTAAFELHNDLWDKARVAVPTSDSAAADLSKQGFALGAGLKHVSNRWDEQLESLTDAGFDERVGAPGEKKGD